jgi:hypothetical protein
MNQGQMVFAQIMQFASKDVLKWIVKRYDGDRWKHQFSTWRHFLCMSFGQMTHRESMSDTMLMLRLNKEKLYHLGIGKAFDKSTVSRTNEVRNWRIFEEFGRKLIEEAMGLYKDTNQLGVDLKTDVFALDSTTIDLCMDLYWWAHFRPTKAGIKVHTLLNIKNSIPSFIWITGASTHDLTVFDITPIHKGCYYVLDKGYTDFSRLFQVHRKRAFFILRAKTNTGHKKVGSRPTKRENGVIYDWDILLTGTNTSKDYPYTLRQIKFHDKESDKTLVFVTNNKRIRPESIALLYKGRWQIELFFKWIKQNLRILSFWGRNENAVKTQIWIAISTYVLVAIAKKKLNIKHSLYEILQYVSIAPFEKEPLTVTFNEKKLQNESGKANQLRIF